MKKLLALLLSLATLTSGIVPVVAAEEAEDYSYYMEFVEKLNIVEDALSSQGTVSRALLAEYICNIMDGPAAKETADKFFVADNYDQLLIPSTDVGSYDDVPQSDASYKVITRVTDLKIMNGTGYRTFSPDSEVTYRQVATALVRMLGYEPLIEKTNYFKKAEELGLFDGISYNDDKKITYGELARVFYNCWESDIVVAEMEADHLKLTVDEGTNIYAERRSIYREKGQLEKNPFTSINGDGGAGEDSVVIDGIKYTADDEYKFYELIGRDVEVYYYYDEDYGTREILWGYASNRDEVISLSIDDVEKFESYVLSYYDGKKIKNQKVERNFALIYNGIYKAGYTSADFEFETGDITLIHSKDGNGYDVMIVNNYDSMQVTDVNAGDKKVYAKQYYNGNTITFNLANMKDWQIQCFYADGSVANISNITVGSTIDVIQSAGYIKFIISSNIMSDMRVTSVRPDSTYVEYTFGDEIYNMPMSYYNKLLEAGVQPRLGDVYTITLNSFGQFFAIDTVISLPTPSGLVYVTERGTDTFLDGAVGYIRYLNHEGVQETALIAEKAVLYNQNGDLVKLTNGSDVMAQIVKIDGSPYTGIAELEKDEDGKVKTITMPLPATYTKSRKNMLGAMVESKEVICVGGNREDFFENIIPADNCIVYGPLEVTNGEPRRKIMSMAEFSDAEKYVVSAYNFDSSSVRANCIVVDTEVKPSLYTDTDTMYIISDIYEGVYDGEATQMVKAYTTGIYRDSELKEFPVKDFALNVAGTFFDKNETVALKKGDIVTMQFDGSYVKKAYLVYRILGAEGESPLYSTTGKYSDSAVGYERTNPYAIYATIRTGNDFYTLLTSDYLVGSVRSGNMRFFGAHIYDLEEGKYLRYTSQPLSTEIYQEDKNYVKPGSGETDVQGYLTETNMLPTRFMVVEVTGNRLNIRTATTADIITYKEAGSDCSEAFIYSNAGVIKQLVLVNRMD